MRIGAPKEVKDNEFPLLQSQNSRSAAIMS